MYFTDCRGPAGRELGPFAGSGDVYYGQEDSGVKVVF